MEGLDLSETTPALSVVVNALLGGAYLRRALDALLAQDGPRIEIVVPFCPGLDSVGESRREYPAVRFVEAAGLPPEATLADPGLAHLVYDRRRAVGLAAARGAIVALTEDQMVPDPGWCAAVVRAHGACHAAIGGAVEHRGAGALHRALYFCDFGRYQLPFGGGEARALTDQNVSYKRAALEKIRPVWERYYHEPEVHEALRAAGEMLWLAPECVVRMDRGAPTVGSQMRERFAWGRVFGGQRARRVSRLRRLALAALSPAIPALILWRRTRDALRKRNPPGAVLATLPAMALLAMAWACGEAWGYVTARPFPGAVKPCSTMECDGDGVRHNRFLPGG
jgi:hypothetical protein